MADQIKLTLLAPISSPLVQLPKTRAFKSSQHHRKCARTFPSESQLCCKEVISEEIISESKRIGPTLPIGSCNGDIVDLISRFNWVGGKKGKKKIWVFQRSMSKLFGVFFFACYFYSLQVCVGFMPRSDRCCVGVVTATVTGVGQTQVPAEQSQPGSPQATSPLWGLSCAPHSTTRLGCRALNPGQTKRDPKEEPALPAPPHSCEEMLERSRVSPQP